MYRKRLAKVIMTALLAASLTVTPVFAAPTVNELQQKKAEEESKVSSLQAELTELLTKMGALEADLIEKGTEVTQATQDLEGATEKEKQQYEDMKLRIKYMYEEGDTTLVERLLTADSVSELLNQADFVQNVHSYDRQMLKEYVETKEEISTLKDTLETEMANMEEMQDAYEVEKDNLNTTIETHRANVADFDTQLQAAVQAAAEAAARREAELRAAAEAAARAQAQAAQVQQSQNSGNSVQTQTSAAPSVQQNTGASANSNAGSGNTSSNTNNSNGNDSSTNNNSASVGTGSSTESNHGGTASDNSGAETNTTQNNNSASVTEQPAAPAPAPVPEPIPEPEPEVPESAPVVSGGSGDGIVSAAYGFLGIPYVWGGTTTAGFDCSGMVQAAHAAVGISLPRVSESQGASGQAVAGMGDALPGDIVCYGYHVGIYIGGGQMIHAPEPGDVVKVSEVYGSPWFRRCW